MKTQITSLALVLLGVAGVVSAAETGSFADAFANHPSRAKAWGAGDHVQSQSLVDEHMAHARSSAGDATSRSFSCSTVVQGNNGELIGMTLNITVSPLGGGYSTGFSRAQGRPVTANVEGRTSPQSSRISVQSHGRHVLSLSEAVTHR